LSSPAENVADLAENFDLIKGVLTCRVKNRNVLCGVDLCCDDADNLASSSINCTILKAGRQ
jgi:hypothetical protein